MKIKELKIEKFGSIKNAELKITDGMNFLYGFSEAEKNAIVDFIIIMLYGTVDNYRTDIRQIYLPEDGSDISGSIIFEHDDQSFELKRIFDKNRRKKDKITLTNITKNTSQELPFNIRPGEYIFNVSKEIFWRNSYINESAGISMMKTSHSGIMSSMLSNLISTASETTSVSDVAKCLNSYCDTHKNNSPAYAVADKKQYLDNLKDELNSALETENKKLSLQSNCSELQKQYTSENKTYNKLKSRLEIQDILIQIDDIEKTVNSPELFSHVSAQFNDIKSILKQNRVESNRKNFDKANEKYKRVKHLANEKDEELTKVKNASVELGRYTPKGDSESLQKVIDNQKLIEQAHSTLDTLNNQLTEKLEEQSSIKENVSEARLKLELAEQDLIRHNEMANMKISQAEERLHNSSQEIDLAPVKKSKNLFLAFFILLVLFALLIIFINNTVMTIIISLLILSCMYTIGVKVGKERKIRKHTRVDENEMRANELSLRNMKNQANSDRDKLNSKIAAARNQLKDLQKKESKVKHQLESLKKEISETKNMIEHHTDEKSKSEKHISQPDPKFYSIRSEIAESERKISMIEKEISEINSEILNDLSPIREFENIDEAYLFIESNLSLINEYNSLSEKLDILGNKEKLEYAKSHNNQRIIELKQRLNQLTGGKEVKKVSTEEYNELKKLEHSLLENTSKLKDKYIEAITSMKIQYNDSNCCAVIDKKIQKLEKETEETENLIKSVKIAIDSFNDTLCEIREKYAPSVARRTSEILAELTNNKYSSISIKGGKIVIKDKDKNPVNFETINKSTCDQIYFSLRLAVSEITAGSVRYPIILDDVFERLNETKAAVLLKFLVKYAEKSQIIIFSNHNMISNLISIENIPTDNINIISFNK